MNKIYFDHAATTPISNDVLNHMFRILEKNYGNPSSIHQLGQSSRALIENSRRQIAKAINCSSKEIFFTSGGTESNNITIKNLLQPGDHLITSTIEHPAILKPAEDLAQNGIEVSYVKPNKYGIIEPQKIEKEIKKNTKLISIMMVNNEMGTINPLEEISLIKNNVLLHTDAVQAFGKIPLDVSKIGIDFDSPDGQPCHLILLTLSSENEPLEHRKFINRFRTMSENPKTRYSLIESKSSKEIIEIIKNWEKEDSKMDDLN